MSRPPPKTVEQKLALALAQWQRWHSQPPLPGPPVIDRPLRTGHSNHNFLTAGQRRFVVRIDGEDPVHHGLNRAAEWRCLQDAHEAGLAPQPVYRNPDLDCLVCQYLPPDGATQSSPVDDPASIARLLRGIHRLPARRQRLDLPRRIQRYEQNLVARQVTTTSRLAQAGPLIAARLEAIVRTREPQVLCHNDLLRANRISSGGRLYAIDWEYAAMGSAFYDLATVIEGDGWQPDAAEQFLAAYLQRSPSTQERQAVDRYRAIYLYLEQLWYRGQAGRSVSREWLDQREERLAGLLGIRDA